MSDHRTMKPPSLWRQEPDELTLLSLGKLAEEASELASRAARCIIQGLDAIDPDSGETNRAELEKEIADVFGLGSLNISRLQLDMNLIASRASAKSDHKEQWLKMVETAIATERGVRPTEATSGGGTMTNGIAMSTEHEESARDSAGLKHAALAPTAPAVPESVRRLSEAATQGEWLRGESVRGEARLTAHGAGNKHTPEANVSWTGFASFITEVDDRPSSTGEANASFAVAAVNYVRTLLSTPSGRADTPPATTEDDTHRYGICDEPLIAGQPVLTDVELGTVHAACCGPERESYVKNIDTGEPLEPDDPIPVGRPYEADTPPAGGGAVPEGWRLVPIEETEEMWLAGRSADTYPGDSYAAVWRGMLAAAPAAPEPAAGGGREIEAAPSYGIIDPDYAKVFTIARCLAWAEGYAMMMHGSFTRDLDLLAVPWTERASDPEKLVRRIEQAADLRIIGDGPGYKPHGRLAWTLRFTGFGDPRFVDIGVMPRSIPSAPTGAEAAGRGEAWMQTYRLPRFRVLDPRPDDILIEDIAHHLAQAARYGGAGIRFVSVAEHSVHLARSAAPEHKLWALLHDAPEAYLHDVVRPVKRTLVGYKEAEDRLMRAICQRFGLPLEMPREVKRLDNRICIDERAQNMAPSDLVWTYGGETEPLDVTMEYWTPEQAEREFLALFAELTGQSVTLPCSTPSADAETADEPSCFDADRYDQGECCGGFCVPAILDSGDKFNDGRLETIAAPAEAQIAGDGDLKRLRRLAQSRYELLRECQSEFKALGCTGLVETIESALSRSTLPDPPANAGAKGRTADA